MTKQHAYQHTYVLDLTLDTSAYADGDSLTDQEYELPYALNQGTGGIIQQIVVIDLAKQDQAIELVFFHTEPSNTTFSKNDALDIHDTDLDAALGSITVEASVYQDYSDNSLATKDNIGFCYNLDPQEETKKSLWVAPVSRGTGTYASGDIRIRITVWFD